MAFDIIGPILSERDKSKERQGMEKRLKKYFINSSWKIPF